MAGHDPYDLPGDAPNPYAAPRADLKGAVGYGPGGMEVPPFSIGAVWNMAWSIYKERMWLTIGIVFGVGVINYLFGLVLGFGGAAIAGPMQGAGGQANPNPGLFFSVQIVIMLASIVFSLWLASGQIVAFLKIARRRHDANFNDVFSGGPYVLSIILASLVVGLMALGVVVVVMIPFGFLAYYLQQNNPGGGAMVAVLIAGYVVAIFVAIFALVRVVLFQYAIVDRQLGGLDAIRHVYRISQGHALSLIGTMIVAGLVGILGVLACGVGLIFTIPLTTLMYPCAYLILDNQPSVTGEYGRQGDLVDL